MTKIREEVYKKLWELFRDECPYYKSNLQVDIYKHSEPAQKMIILEEILPAEIHGKHLGDKYQKDIKG